MKRLLLVFCLVSGLMGQSQQDARAAELERLNSMIEELTALKAQTAAMESRLETLLRALQEQRGALQVKPAAYDALKAAAAPADPPADQRPATVRCAALTGSGKRCTRAAMEGSRYCKQHALAKQK